MPGTDRRRDMIRDLISRNEVRTQEQLRALLEAEGIETTQSTLSRDLHEMGVIKRPDGYEIPDSPLNAGAGRRELQRIVREIVRDADRGHNLIVLRTEPGHEQRLVEIVRHAQFPEVLGVLSGPGTVWIASRTVTQSKTLLGHFRAMMGG